MSYIDEACKYCCTCSMHTIEGTRFDPIKNGSDYQVSTDGLICTLCNRMMCKDCAEDFSEAIGPHKSHRYHQDMHPYLEALHSYALHSKDPPSDFVGHCCLIDQHYRRHGYSSPRTASTPTERVHSSSGKISIGGAIFLPEYSLILPPADAAMDVFGYGHDEGIDPTPHCVFDEDFSNLCHSTNVSPSTRFPSSYTSITKLVPVESPHLLWEKKKKKKKKCRKYKVKLIYIPKTMSEQASHSFFKRYKGSNTFPPQIIEDSYYLPADAEDSTIDATIVVGYDAMNPSSNGALLLFRFHRMDPNIQKDSEKKRLLQCLQTLLKNNGIERKRTGGSSGFIQYTRALKTMMATNNSTPRKSKGVVFLRQACDTAWDIFYVPTNRDESTIVKCAYSNPVPGGNFQMEDWMFDQFPFLMKFASTKPLAALILKELPAVIQHDDVPQIVLNPKAIAEELENIRAVRALTRSFILRHNQSNPSDKIVAGSAREMCEFYKIYSYNFLMFTLVLHAVGLHKDTFADGEVSLENRCCFFFKLHDGETKVSNTGAATGRGGKGDSYYGFALLDWTAYQRQRRRVWTQPENQGIVGSYTYFQNLLNTHRVTLTQTRWNTFRTNQINAQNNNQN